MRSRIVIGLVVFLISGLFFYSSFVSAQPIKQARILLSDKAQMKEIFELNLDIAYVQYGEYIDIITDQDGVDRLRQMGYNVRIVQDDLVSFFQSRFDKSWKSGTPHLHLSPNSHLKGYPFVHILHTSLNEGKQNLHCPQKD